MHVSRGAALAACATLLFAAAGCGQRDATAADSHLVRLYGTDGNMANGLGDAFKDQPGILAGMKGTTPLTPLSDDFKHRLLTVDPQLADYTYAGESYDAVAISALAAELAGTTDPQTVAKYINGVTTRGANGVECSTIAECLKLAHAGKDIQYRGVSLKRGGFTDAGEPSAASYATLHFDSRDKIDDGKTEFVGAGDDNTATKIKPPAPRKANPASEPLRIGGLLPLTGDLAFLSAPMVAGSKLAVREINAAGGVLGQDVEWYDGDDGTNNMPVATSTLERHIADGVQVIIGAAASGMTTKILPKVVAAGLILFSSSNTAAGLSTADDKGLYFRTAPSDILQGKALADVIMRDGPHKISIVARKDAYGEGLQVNVEQELEKAGISPAQLKLLTYEPPPDADAAVSGADEIANSIKEFQADAVVIIGFNESSDIIKALTAAGMELQH